MDNKEMRIQELMDMAKLGDSWAQSELGLKYAMGEGLPQDVSEAFKWFKLAAENGEAAAQSNLARCYFRGIAVDQDCDLGLKWYEKAADQGLTSAQDVIMNCYENGDERIEKDDQKLLQYQKKYADMGNVKAQTELGTRYATGTGVDTDYNESAKWLRLAAEQGDAIAQYNLAICYGNGYGVEEDITEAKKWADLSAEQGFEQAAEYSKTLISIPEEELILYAEKGNIDYQYMHSVARANDAGINSEDNNELISWLTLQAENGDVIIQNFLGRVYLSGDLDQEIDYKKALMWGSKAAEQGYADAFNLLGTIYTFGAGVKRDLAKGREYQIKAAELGHGIAAKNVGDAYCNGNGTEVNEDKALYYYRMAVENGETSAKVFVDELEKELEEEEMPFDDRFKRAINFLEKSKKMIGMDEGRLALSSVRNALESIVKQLSALSGLNTSTKEATLETMINELYDSGIIDREELDLMHSVRMVSNKGSHIDIEDDEIKIEEAIEASSTLERLFEKLSDKDYVSNTKRTKKLQNSPMVNPDYYSANRRYYGMWAYCMTKQDLLVIPEYAALYQKAIYENDIEAMLSIAVGFLPKKINWGSNGLIDMPPCKFKGMEYGQDNAYDTRYYYWILKAVNTATCDLYNGNIPQKYIATAMWEACLYAFHYGADKTTYNYVGDVASNYNQATRSYDNTPIYRDPGELVQTMFDAEIIDEVRAFLDGNLMWSYLVEDVFAKDNIVAAIYQDALGNSDSKIRFLMYCAMTALNIAYYSLKADYWYRISDYQCIKYYISDDYRTLIGNGEYDDTLIEDGKEVSIEMLNCFDTNSFCKKYLEFLRTERKEDILKMQEPTPGASSDQTEVKRGLLKKIFG